ncbi:MAG: metallophosphoesterase [Pseudomonadota bacterium]
MNMSHPFPRLFALSDVHVDYSANMTWLENLSNADYQQDTLILAGDVSDSLDKLTQALNCLREKFADIFFVPGNHDVWVRRDNFEHSLEKFTHIIDLCTQLGVHTEPARCGNKWVVPLFSWYRKPEEGPDSLFAEKPGEDPSLRIWADNNHVRWPEMPTCAADYFLQLNQERLEQNYDAPIVSFSHFLPRRELIFASRAEIEAARNAGAYMKDRAPQFNFSRVAGCAQLDKQIIKLGAQVHIYGHQHRNRQREIDGVVYLSSCLGYHHERKRGMIRDMLIGPCLVTLPHETIEVEQV